jgi:RNA polymerase sigma factor (sigma-70 family)
MTQDIFRSLWERREVLEINVPPERYLVRAAKFKVFEYLRNVSNRERHLDIIKQESAFHSYATEEQVMYSTLSTQIAGLIDGLPNRCRQVFRMSREEGFTNKEIAKILSITERAVEYHIARALDTLRLRLQDYLT